MSASEADRPCRHQHTWLLGNRNEWCYQCGALRDLALVENTLNRLTPTSPWCRPTGRDGANPFTSWAKRRARYRNRKEEANG